jgi:hypothetical protein
VQAVYDLDGNTARKQPTRSVAKMKINHEATKNTKKEQKNPSRSSFLRGRFSAGAVS